MSSGRSRSLYVFIRRATEQIAVIMETYPLCQLRIEFCSTFFYKGELYVWRKVWGINSVDFEATSQLLITYSAFIKYLVRNGNTMKHCINYL